MFPVDHPTYLHLPAFLILHTLIFLRSILCWIGRSQGGLVFTVTISKSLKRAASVLGALPCCRWETVQLCPFLCDSGGQSASPLHVDWAVCSPKDTLFLVNHCPATCFKFPFLASLIQCPQGMLDSLWGQNRLDPEAPARHGCRPKLMGFPCISEVDPCHPGVLDSYLELQKGASSIWNRFVLMPLQPHI